MNEYSRRMALDLAKKLSEDEVEQVVNKVIARKAGNANLPPAAAPAPVVTSTALTDLSFQCLDELAPLLDKKHREILRMMGNLIWDAALLDRMPEEARQQAAARLDKARALLAQVKQAAPALSPRGLPKAAYRFKRMFEHEEQ